MTSYLTHCYAINLFDDILATSCFTVEDQSGFIKIETPILLSSNPDHPAILPIPVAWYDAPFASLSNCFL